MQIIRNQKKMVVRNKETVAETLYNIGHDIRNRMENFLEEEYKTQYKRNVPQQMDAKNNMRGVWQKRGNLKTLRRKFIHIIREMLMKCLSHIQRKDGVENLTLRGNIADKRCKGKKQVSYFTRLCQCVKTENGRIIIKIGGMNSSKSMAIHSNNILTNP